MAKPDAEAEEAQSQKDREADQCRGHGWARVLPAARSRILSTTPGTCDRTLMMAKTAIIPGDIIDRHLKHFRQLVDRVGLPGVLQQNEGDQRHCDNREQLNDDLVDHRRQHGAKLLLEKLDGDMIVACIDNAQPRENRECEQGRDDLGAAEDGLVKRIAADHIDEGQHHHDEDHDAGDRLKRRERFLQDGADGALFLGRLVH